MDDHWKDFLYPQFRIISTPAYTEYRYYSQRPQSNEKSSQLGRNTWWFVDAAIIAVLSYLCFLWEGDRRRVIAFTGFILAYSYWRCTAVVYESVLVIPPHGVQLETHRGPLQYPLFASRRFVPAIYMRNIIINEGLHRWGVRYYLAVMLNSPGEPLELAVAYENTLPHFPVLLKVYRGAMDSLIDEPAP